MLGGVDSASPTNLVSDEAWLQQHNMSIQPNGLIQVPRKFSLGRVRECYHSPVLAILTFPSGTENRASFVALTRDTAYLLRGAPSVVSPVQLKHASGAAIFEWDTDYRRWAVAKYNDSYYFVNELNPVYGCDGQRIFLPTPDSPRARYIETFFDHIFLARTTVNGVLYPNRLQWSGLYNFEDWQPKNTNEADHFDFVEQAQELPLDGVTGVHKIGNTLFILTPNAVYPVSYVGLPKIVQVGLPIAGVGNGLPYTSIKCREIVYFFDAASGLFYSLSANGVKAISAGVSEYLRNNINPDFSLASRSWAYHNADDQEVVWVFVSKMSNGPFDKAVVYHYASDKWYTRSVEDIHSVGGLGVRAKTMAELSGQAKDLSGKARDLNISTDGFPRLYGSSYGEIFRDELSTDSKESLLAAEVPVLETKDFVHDDAQEEKEVDTLAIHAGFSDAAGIKVEYDGRNNLDDDLSYKDPRVCRKDDEHGRLTDIPFHGRALRYKFTAIQKDKPVESITLCRTNVLNPLKMRMEVAVAPGGIVTDATRGATGAQLSDFYLTAFRAPSVFDIAYVYGANEFANPYADIPHSKEMLEEAVAQATKDVVSLFPNSIAGPPSWQYFSGEFNGMAAAFWPYWLESYPPGQIYSQGWRVYVPILEYFSYPIFGYYSPSDPLGFSRVEATVPGVAGAFYNAKVRVRAVTSLMTYAGGTALGYVSTEGQPSSQWAEVLSLQTSSPTHTYFLNRADAVSDYNVGLDYTIEIPVLGQSQLTLTLRDLDHFFWQGDANNEPIEIAGVGKKHGVWAILDIELEAPTNDVSSIFLYKGGGVRGFRFQGFVDNVYQKKAER